MVESSDLLSYLFYVVGAALLVGSLGYALGAGLMNLIGIDLNLLAGIVGIVVAIVAIAVTFYFSLQEYVTIVATAIERVAVTSQVPGADGARCLRCDRQRTLHTYKRE